MEKDVLGDNIKRLFHSGMMQVNKEAHLDFEAQLDAALNIHMNIYKIACVYRTVRMVV